MSYKKVVKRCNDNEILYTDVDTTKGFIVGRYESNVAFIIIHGDWYLIFEDRIEKNSYNHNIPVIVFAGNNPTVFNICTKDVRYYDNFFEASQYINEIIGERND